MVDPLPVAHKQAPRQPEESAGAKREDVESDDEAIEAGLDESEDPLAALQAQVEQLQQEAA